MKNKKHSWTIGVISFGTLLEWAEYTFYGYLAISLSALFFPANLPHIAILKTYGIFAAGYIMRPLGAILFGTIGDRLGRKPALIASLFLMGIATFAIGCLPSYHSIGVLAPSLLLIFRMLQGIAISGEYNGAGIFLHEKVANRYPCLTTSWVSASAAFGMVLGGIAAYLVSHPLAPSYAWRVPFLLGGLSCFLGWRFRYALPESLQIQHDTKSTLPFITIFKESKHAILTVGAIAALTGVFVYICNIYVVVFLKQVVHLPTHHATFFAIFGETLVAFFIPIFAWMADHVGAVRQYRFALIATAISTPILFLLMLSGQYLWIGCAMALYGLLNGLLCGPMIKIICDQFPQSTRYTGISFAWSFAAALFSGTAPIVAQFLTIHFDWPLAPSIYVSAIAMLTYLVCSKLPLFSSAPRTLKDSPRTILRPLNSS